MRRVAALLALAMMGSTQTSLASPIGFWKADDGAIIKIRPCGRDLCGFVVSTYPLSHDRETGNPL
jgi:hypothetical protein